MPRKHEHGRWNIEQITGIEAHDAVDAAYHSRGFQLVQHEPFTSMEDAIKQGTDIVEISMITPADMPHYVRG